MSVTCGFYNSNNHDRTYDAVQMSSIFDGIIRDGVFMSIGDKLMVKANSGLTLNVGSGRAWFNHTWTLNDADLLIRWEAVSGEEYPVDLDGNNVTPETVADRIDAVILRVNSDNSVRNNFIGIKKGVPSTVTPEKPVLINTETVHEYALAYVTITHGMQEITQSNIENAIGTSATPFITGILETVNADALLAQWQTQYAEHIKTSDDTFDAFMSSKRRDFTNLYGLTEQECDDLIASVQASLNANQATFDAWFANLKNQLTANQAANLQRQIDALRDGLDTLTLVHIAVSYSEDLVGANITATNEDGTESYTVIAPADGVVIFDGMSLGTWTVTEDLYETSSEVNTVFYGNYHTRVGGGVYITVKYPEELDGENITVSKGSTMITKIGTSALETLFVVASYGIWNVYAEYNGEPITAQIACYNDGEYEVELTLSKWGYQQWLDAAGITETFDSLEEVLADEKTVRTLMTKHAAVDYAIEWFENVPNDAETVFQNDICAKWITLRDYALDTFYANEACKAVMDKSWNGTDSKYAYGEWGLVPQVPKMTSNTLPYGKAFCSTYHNDDDQFNGWKLFDDNSSTQWASKTSDTVGAYAGYKFVGKVRINAISIFPKNINYPAKIKVQGSDDMSTWVDVSGVLDVNGGVVNTIKFNNENSYVAYRIYVVALNSGGLNSNVYSLQFYAWQPKTPVPEMTSNTAPYGEVYDSTKLSGQEVWRGISGRSRLTISNAAGAYYGYKFVNPVCLTLIEIFTDDPNNTFIVQGSNDGSSWTNICEIIQIQNDFDGRFIKIPNTNYYTSYRLYKKAKVSTAQYYLNYRFSFYGRELKVSVPKMTSSTAPWGEVISNHTDANMHINAFDGNESTEWQGTIAANSTTHYDCNDYIGYDFKNPVVVKKFSFRTRSATNGATYNVLVYKYNIEGSNDGSIWNTLYSYNNSAGTYLQDGITINNEIPYRYYRLRVLSTGWTAAIGANVTRICRLQFYGLDYSEHEERDYIYDHGIVFKDLESTNYSNDIGPTGLYTENGIIKTSNAISMSGKNLIRVDIGDKIKTANNYLQVYPSKSGGSSTAYNNAVGTDPHNTFLSISAITASEFIFLDSAASDRCCTWKALWLE